MGLFWPVLGGLDLDSGLCWGMGPGFWPILGSGAGFRPILTSFGGYGAGFRPILENRAWILANSGGLDLDLGPFGPILGVWTWILANFG